MNASLPVRVALTTILFAVSAFGQSRPSSAGSASLPIRGWWTMDQHVIQDLDRAAEFGINLLMFEEHSQCAWNEILDRLALYDFNDKYKKHGKDREQTEVFRARYREITAAARRHGVPCYLQTAEVHVPKGLDPVTFENPEVWEVLGERLREVFRALPDLTGLTIYLAEGQLEVDQMRGVEPSRVRRARKVIDTLWAACRAEHRKFMVGTFIHTLPMLEAVSQALREFPPHPDFAVLQYCCPNDWGLYDIFNPSIGRVGPHPEILGFDFNAENWGESVYPFIQVDFMAERLRQARARSANIVGVAGWTAWYEHRTLTGTFNEANVYAGAELAAHPDRDPREILLAWCANRFGEKAASTAADCLARTFPIIFKAQHVFGYWVDTGNKSGIPSLKEMDDFFIRDVFGEALGKWYPERKPTWRKIQSPDVAFLNDVLQEKSEAITLAQKSLSELRSAKDQFRPADFNALERAFRFDELWARIWRDLMRAFFLRQIGRKQGWTQEGRAQLEDALQVLSLQANELESNFGKGFPRGPDRIREFIRDIKSGK